MPPTVTVATMAILTTIELFIWLKAFAPFLVSHDLTNSAWYWPVDLILVMLESVYGNSGDSFFVF
ncbi:hypothetical protein [Shewanella sp.]|uniref:hypothetical protein n=1 Tax=Shewanella sp. TaxID=50422 RepID=UPI003A89C2A3